MATVSELKERARQFEQEGQRDKALQIYRHILKHFEGGPSVVKVLPLYVKVGDLLLKSRRPAEAVEAYERAAEAYAEHGAAQRVAALCNKIERVDPSRVDCYAHFARRLIAHDHVGSARDVLAGYAEARELTDVEEALDDLAGRSPDEIKPMLERLLSAWGAGESAPTGEAARRMSSQLREVTDTETGDLDPEPAPLAAPAPAAPEPVAAAAPPAPPAEGSTIGRLAPVEFITQDSPPPPPPPLRRRPETPVGATAPRAAISQEERPSGDRFGGSPLARYESSLRPALIGFAAGVVVGLLLSVILPFGGSDDPAPAVAAATDPTPPRAPATPPPAPPADTSPDPNAADSTLPPAAGRESGAAGNEVPADTAVADDPPPAEADGPIVVEGLAVESVNPSELRGVPGFRVVHTVAPFGELTIESYPDTTAGTAIGRIRVLVTPPDTLVGIVRLAGHMVYASAIMPEDSLRSLMGRLVPRSN